MFFLLRAGLVIGVIFYLSPLRSSMDAPDLGGLVSSALDAVTPPPAAPKSSPPEAPPAGVPGTVAEAERLWRNLPPEARQAVLDRLRAQAASSLNEAVAAVQAPRPASGEAPRTPAGDTLRADDRRPAWRGDALKP